MNDKQKVAQQRLMRKLAFNKASTTIFPSEAPQRIAELKNLSDQAKVPIRIIHVDLSTDTETITNHEPQ